MVVPGELATEFTAPLISEKLGSSQRGKGWVAPTNQSKAARRVSSPRRWVCRGWRWAATVMQPIPSRTVLPRARIAPWATSQSSSIMVFAPRRRR